MRIMDILVPYGPVFPRGLTDRQIDAEYKHHNLVTNFDIFIAVYSTKCFRSLKSTFY